MTRVKSIASLALTAVLSLTTVPAQTINSNGSNSGAKPQSNGQPGSKGNPGNNNPGGGNPGTSNVGGRKSATGNPGANNPGNNNPSNGNNGNNGASNGNPGNNNPGGGNPGTSNVGGRKSATGNPGANNPGNNNPSNGNNGNNGASNGNPGNNNPGGGNPGTSNVGGRNSSNGNPGANNPGNNNPSNGNPGNNGSSNGNPGNGNPGNGNPGANNPGNNNPSFSEGHDTTLTASMRMPNGDVVQIVKGKQGPVHNAGFSKPVRNLAMKVTSSSHDSESVLVFETEFVIDTQDPSCGEAGFLRRCLIKEGKVLRVLGGAGSIRFIEKTSDLAWTTVSTDADLKFSFAVSQSVIAHDIPPCDLGCARTLTQGGWSNTSRTSPLNGHFFAEAFPHGLTIGADGRSITLTSAAAVRAFLPNGGTPRRLEAGHYTDLGRAHVKNVLAGQTVAAMLNVALNPGMAAAVLQGHLPYAGYTVQDVINMANAALGADDCHMPSKHVYSQLTEALDKINQSFPDGHSRHYLSCPEEH